jgi:DNA primase large subunit
MAKYPFLTQTREHVAAVGIDLRELGELQNIIGRAQERIEATFEFDAYRQNLEPYKRPDVEIASFPVAILVVSGVEDRVLTERFALSEAKRVHKYLADEKDEMVLRIAQYFHWDVHPSQEGPCSYQMHFSNYVSNAASGRLVHAPEWKLINRQLHDGQVAVTLKDIRRLLQEEVKRYIEARTREKPRNLPQVVQDLVNEVKAEFLKRKPHLTEFDQIVRAEESEYPPCIVNLLGRATKGKHLSHAERFTLVTYLVHQGITVDGIINLFSGVADFAEAKTRYQVEHLAGERGGRTAYTTYNCSTLQTHGICPRPEDLVCKRIRNPLTYHVRKKAIEHEAKGSY